MAQGQSTRVVCARMLGSSPAGHHLKGRWNYDDAKCQKQWPSSQSRGSPSPSDSDPAGRVFCKQFWVRSRLVGPLPLASEARSAALELCCCSNDARTVRPRVPTTRAGGIGARSRGAHAGNHPRGVSGVYPPIARTAQGDSPTQAEATGIMTTEYAEFLKLDPPEEPAIKANPSLNGTLKPCDRDASDPRPKMDAGNRDLADITPAALRHVAAANNPPHLFRHGNLPSRMERDDNEAPIIRPLTLDRMRHEMARAIFFTVRKKVGQNEIEEPAVPPKDIVADALATPDLPFLVLRRIVECPAFAPDGTLHVIPG